MLIFDIKFLRFFFLHFSKIIFALVTVSTPPNLQTMVSKNYCL
ncbi:hypothetical protein Calab_0350 [Caldithrix abyssi DSM 13497]|uniref:Uncharacterized protein n=1 Tax=Caldithrix abyssi DSM 13497 TaxID=880073 RepID=H1XQA9_CALAY|nr:hypothetical protein Calab_0350 [Caldithrix abyssi DSM 13497]